MATKIAGVPLPRRCVVLLTLLLPLPATGQAQGSCPRATDSLVAAGYRAFRADSAPRADSIWSSLLVQCPSAVDARLGLGLLSLHRGALVEAESAFREVIRRSPGYVDAWLGLTRAEVRKGDAQAAREAVREAHRLAPARDEVASLWTQLFPDGDRAAPPHPVRPDSLVLVSRTHGEKFQVRANGDWRDIYLQGANLGVALPGRYPSEFPLDSARYAGWLDTLGTMGANTVRVYTILPPAFYRALRAYDLAHAERPIWLIHGVWTELPPNDDFEDSAWKGEFHEEMKRVVDLIHGARVLAPRPGHASGTYDADVSRWTLAYIIGREWEPFAVKAFDAAHSGSRTYAGAYLEVVDGSPMDAWMTAECDYLLGYEHDSYFALRPIAYTNWPTLDPLTHVTEANTDEEAAWRRRSGRVSRSNKLEYENDAVGLDAALVHPTAANPAGWFASYHAYPYYPDFIDLDPVYSQARSSRGPSNYFGYLSDLHRHLAGIPLLISEYGVPSSRGDAHRQAQGWDHGGHDEAAQAAIDVRLTQDIKESGAAGAIIFALLDEWFKKNWLVIDLEIPLDPTRQWHNAMDAEQNYGIWAMVAGDTATQPHLGGDAAKWRALQVAENGSAGKLHIGSDASWVYIALELPGMGGEPIDWRRQGIQIPIDSYRRDLGQRRLPGGVRSRDVGFEFLLDLADPDSGRMLITPDYTPYARLPQPADQGDDHSIFYHRPAASVARDDGAWAPMEVITNRARFGRDGTFFPARGVDRGALRFGTEATSTLSDWWYDEAAGMIEVRLPWGLLNVTDPSTATVLHDSAGVGDFGTTTADGIVVGAVRYQKDRHRTLATTPTLDGEWRAAQFHPWQWPTWDEPTWHQRLKPLYAAMREAWTE